MPDPRVRLSEHVEGDGIAFFEAARARGLEGIMAKERRSPYVPGSADDGLAEGQDPAGAGARRRRLDARAPARRSSSARCSSACTRMARCATPARSAPGSRRRRRAELLAALARLATEAPAVRRRPRRGASRGATWVRPELVIRAEFAGWTGDGLVRQAAYKGIDLGKDPRAVRREVAAS